MARNSPICRSNRAINTIPVLLVMSPPLKLAST